MSCQTMDHVMSDAAAVPAEITVRVGRRVHRAPYRRGDTVLETLRRAGIAMPSQCEQGYCGTCAVQLLQGEIDMRVNDVIDADDMAAGIRLACQGKPVGDVVEIELY